MPGALEEDATLQGISEPHQSVNKFASERNVIKLFMNLSIGGAFNELKIYYSMLLKKHARKQNKKLLFLLIRFVDTNGP